MDSQNIHPARRLDFDELVARLNLAAENRLVVRTSNNSGLTLYVYTTHCVYEGLWDEITTTARGLILNVNERRVVATPFPKFFNVGERGLTIPDMQFDTFEKLDGSLIIIFHYAGRWNCATKGAFGSEQALWAQAQMDSSDLSALVAGTTYLAEATYPENKIVIHYEEPGLVMLAAYAEDGVELSYEEVVAVSEKLGWRVAQRHHFLSASDLLTSAEALPRTQEGFVLRFIDGSRLKMKGSEYRRIHALISRVTPLAVWEALSAQDGIEYFRRELPEEFWGDFDCIHAMLTKRVSALIERIENLAKSLQSLSDKEVGLKLDSIDAELRPFIFNYRKHGPDSSKIRQSLYRAIRPVANDLDGYTPSYTLKRVHEEAS